MPAVRLITWNLNGRVAAASLQVAALAQRRPDVVACQEVRRSSLGDLTEGFRAHGFECVDTVPPRRRTGKRAFGLLIACRHPIRRLDLAAARAPWKERLLAVEVAAPGGGFRLLNVGVPPGATNGWTKVGTIEACLRVMAGARGRPLIVVGDFNTPQDEGRDRRIVTWGQTILGDGTVRLDRGMLRWDLAERGLFEGNGLHRLRDAFRDLHGFGRRASSWYWRSGHRRIGRRFDHCFVGPEITVKACEYLHDLRRRGLSDHSPLEARVVVGGRRRGGRSSRASRP